VKISAGDSECEGRRQKDRAHLVRALKSNAAAAKSFTFLTLSSFERAPSKFAYCFHLSHRRILELRADCAQSLEKPKMHV
jgi:hypothetical protein